MGSKVVRNTPALDEDLNFMTTTENQPDLIVNDKWFIKYAGGVSVVRIRIAGVTKHTVEINELSGMHGSGTRYKIIDIDFIEKIED
jgi:hypothetical protein